MTDNEIVKALERCNKGKCEGCPYGNNRLSIWDCENKLNADVLDLIKRQLVEIEKLQQIRSNMVETLKKCECFTTTKSEAVKEFAGMKEAEIEKDKVNSIMGEPISLKKLFDYFNKIKKEMLGENAFIEGTELALDYGLPVPEEDLEKYEKIVDKSKKE